MWTMQNTEGFNQAELDTINAAVERVWADAEDADEDYLAAINDAANNEWRDGINAEQLEAAIRKVLGA